MPRVGKNSLDTVRHCWDLGTAPERQPSDKTGFTAFGGPNVKPPLPLQLTAGALLDISPAVRSAAAVARRSRGIVPSGRNPR